jgi:hypothetical protein
MLRDVHGYVGEQVSLGLVVSGKIALGSASRAIQLSQSRCRLRALAEELRNTGIDPGHGSHTVGVLDREQEV